MRFTFRIVQQVFLTYAYRLHSNVRNVLITTVRALLPISKPF